MRHGARRVSVHESDCDQGVLELRRESSDFHIDSGHSFVLGDLLVSVSFRKEALLKLIGALKQNVSSSSIHTCEISSQK